MTEAGMIIYLSIITVLIVLIIITNKDIMNLYDSYKQDNSIELTTHKRTTNEQYANFEEVRRKHVPIMPKVHYEDFAAMLRVVARFLVPVFMIVNGISAFILFAGVLLFAYQSAEWFTVVLSSVLLIVELIGFSLYIALLKHNKEVFNESH